MRIILILSAFALSSCNHPKPEQKTSLTDTIPFIDLRMKSPKPNKLIGEWKVYETIYPNSSILCYECPSINFNDDGTIGTGYLKWQVKDKTLFITGATNTDNIFSDSEYEMFYPGNDSTKLILTQPEKKYSYRLGKNPN